MTAKKFKRRDFVKASSMLAASGYWFTPLPFRQEKKSQDGEIIPIIDTHLHLWDLSYMDYPWLENRKSILSKNFLVPQYQEAVSAHPVEKMVFVECARLPEQYLKEVDWVVLQAEKDTRIQGMVAYFPLLQDKTTLTSAMEELASRQLVRGIRFGVDQSMMRDDDFIDRVRQLADYNLSFDLNISPELMPAAVSFIQKCPDVRFILNHLCNPNIRDGKPEPWKSHMKELAQTDHVYCKISGAITKADTDNWTKDDIAPFVLHALEVFAEDKVVFGGDWPVVLRAGSLDAWIKTLQQITEKLSFDARKKLFYDNALQCYRL